MVRDSEYNYMSVFSNANCLHVDNHSDWQGKSYYTVMIDS